MYGMNHASVIKILAPLLHHVLKQQEPDAQKPSLPYPKNVFSSQSFHHLWFIV
jgi:hypothetical protein